MTRLAFDDLGGFDADYFAYYEDLDLGWRAWVMGYDIHYIPTAVCEHHHSHTSQRFAPEIVRRMVIRNSVLTCLKNYDDENLARVMPAMTALAVERAFLKAGLDAGRFEPGGQKLLKPGKAHKTRPVSLDPIGAADLLALHDVFGQWPEVERKRRLVQSRRRRTDAELFPMFLEPLACVEGHASYQELQAGLVRWLGIDRMVEG